MWNSHRKGLILLLALSMGGLAAKSYAQGGPPMITDDTETVPKGHYEINTAFTMEFTKDGHLWGTPAIDWNMGLTKHTQLKVEIPYLVQKNFGEPQVRAWGNLNVGVRWRFHDADEEEQPETGEQGIAHSRRGSGETKNRKWAISVYPQIEFNTPGSRARELGMEDRGPMFLLPFQFQTKINEHWSFNADAGWRFKRGEDEAIYGGVFGREYKKFELLYEAHATSPARNFGDTEAVVNLGTRIPMTKHTTFLASAGRSFLGSRDPQFIGYVGVQWTF
jgi:hypothetical protein